MSHALLDKLCPNCQAYGGFEIGIENTPTEKYRLYWCSDHTGARVVVAVDKMNDDRVLVEKAETIDSWDKEKHLTILQIAMVRVCSAWNHPSGE